jgi:hypothetical protein
MAKSDRLLETALKRNPAVLRPGPHHCCIETRRNGNPLETPENGFREQMRLVAEAMLKVKAVTPAKARAGSCRPRSDVNAWRTLEAGESRWGEHPIACAILHSLFFPLMDKNQKSASAATAPSPARFTAASVKPGAAPTEAVNVPSQSAQCHATRAGRVFGRLV